MKTTEFRCEKCDKLLARLTGERDSLYGHESRYIIEGAGQYLEIKCPRCKHINKKELINDECVFGKETYSGATVHMPKSQVGKDTVDTEALEALNRVSRHGDNV